MKSRKFFSPLLLCGDLAGAPGLGPLVRGAGLVLVVQLAHVVLLQHLPGVARVTHVLEVLCGVLASVLYQDLFSSRMLGTKST